MEKLLASVPDSLKSSEPERSDYYTVQLGDNLNSIASRFGVSITQLAMENNISRKNRIYEGQVLRVPKTGKAATPPPVQVASAETTQTQEMQMAEAAPAPTPTPPAPAATPKVAAHAAAPKPVRPAAAAGQPPKAPATTVDTSQPPPSPVWPFAKKDTGKVTRLAEVVKAPGSMVTPLPAVTLSRRETKLTMKAQAETPVVRKVPAAPAVPAVSPVAPKPAVAAAEPKAPAAPAISDSLKEIAMTAAIPAQKAAPSGRPSVFPKFDVDIYNLETTLSPDGSTAEIRVSTDETIGHYAEWLGIATHRIRQLNQMGGRSDIRIGGAMLIPAEQPALAQMVQTRLEYHMAIEEDFYGRFKVTDVKQKALKRGEALWDICNGPDQIPLWLLKKYNKQLDFGKLMPGAVLWIPTIEEKTDQELREESSASGGIYPAYQSPSETPGARAIYRMP
jgi:membrane-bound lytic murein transglycosylase D